MYIILFIGIAILSFVVQQRLKSKFKKYSQIPMTNGMTGKEVAEKMLRDHGITNVKVVSTSGMLTDHYNPQSQTVNLSEGVYASNSIAAAAVAAHECGHAVQHAFAYKWLNMRSALVPAVSFASKWVHWVILIGIVMIETTPILLEVGIGLFALTTIFSFVTLPVEINASSRAVQWLTAKGFVEGEKRSMAIDALKSAAYTYVVAALSSLATLIYYIFILAGRRD